MTTAPDKQIAMTVAKLAAVVVMMFAFVFVVMVPLYNVLCDALGINGKTSGQAYTAVGCDRCRGTGFSGRLAIYEVALITDAMQDLVAHSAPAAKLREQAIKDGYLPMRTYGWHKALQGETTIEEVISVTSTDHGTSE